MRPHMDNSFGHLDMEDSFYSSSPSGSFSSSASSPYNAVTPNSTQDSFGCQTPSPRRHSSLNFDHRMGAVDMRIVMSPSPALSDYMHGMSLQHNTQGYYRDNYPPVTPPRTGNPMEMSVPAPMSFMEHQMPLQGTPGAYSYGDTLPQSPPFMAHTSGYPARETPSPRAQAAIWMHSGPPMPMFGGSPCSHTSSTSADMGFERIARREMGGGEPRPPRNSTGRPRATTDACRAPRQRSSREASKRAVKPTDHDSAFVFPKGKYDCKHPGCGKKYQRHEHLVRHEKAHSDEPQYFYCHPDCPRKHTTRDRFDNFFSHFKKHTDVTNPNYIPGAEQWWEDNYRAMDKRRKPKKQTRIKREI